MRFSIKLYSEEQSRRVQEILFAKGYRWRGDPTRVRPLRENMVLSIGFFEENSMSTNNRGSMHYNEIRFNELKEVPRIS